MVETMVSAAQKAKKSRVGIISIHPAPYRDATFVALHLRGVLHSKVINLFDLDQRHTFWNLDKSDYPDTVVIKNKGVLRRYRCSLGVLSILARERFDVIVIPGFHYVSLWIALAYCCLSRTPIIFSLDKTRENRIFGVKRLLASKIAPRILRRFSAFWVPGRATRRYLTTLGISSERIFCGSYNLDTAVIQDRVTSFGFKGTKIHSKYSIPENAFVFIMVANVSPKRRYDVLLEAFYRVETECPNAYLLIVGKGAEKQNLGHLKAGSLPNNLRLVGPVPFNDLAALYVAANAYVHTGTESYSTSISYAAIVGIPIIASSEVGATQDWLIDGETGYSSGSEDINGFSEKMILLVKNPKDAERLGENAARLARRYTPDWAAKELETAVEYVLN